MKTKKENRGGPRPGAGRKKGEPTTTISFRVKTDYAEPIKKVLKETIKKLKYNEEKDK